MRTILLALATLFAAYTIGVYCYADPRTNAAAPSPDVATGWALWQEKGCQSCHQLYGLGGYMGPDLTNTASQKGADYMRAFIQSGTGRMPNLGLASTEVDAVLQFLSWVDHSGYSRVPDSAVHWSGSYQFVTVNEQPR